MPSPNIWENTPMVMGVSSRGSGLLLILLLLLESGVASSSSSVVEVLPAYTVDGIGGVLPFGRSRIPARPFVGRGATNEDDGATSNTDNNTLDIDIIIRSLK